MDFDMVHFKYTIPTDILVKLPSNFLDIFADKLIQVFWAEDKQLKLDVFPWITGTVGWYEAFTKACEDLNMTEVLEYYEGLEWYDSDIFDDEICRMLRRWRRKTHVKK